MLKRMKLMLLISLLVVCAGVVFTAFAGSFTWLSGTGTHGSCHFVDGVAVGLGNSGNAGVYVTWSCTAVVTVQCYNPNEALPPGQQFGPVTVSETVGPFLPDSNGHFNVPELIIFDDAAIDQLKHKDKTCPGANWTASLTVDWQSWRADLYAQGALQDTLAGSF